MYNYVNLQPSKTYKTRENAIKAAMTQVCSKREDLRFIISITEDGRFFPVFLGTAALPVIHIGFCVAA